ncbi:MAG: hypothetical protein O9320_09785 [Magnetospirillum sp.]|nr:hypothetical protein [Magnetospirillum sp.]
MLNRNDAARELYEMFCETESLPIATRRTVRIQTIGALQNRFNRYLHRVTETEALSLSQGSMPMSLERHRCSRADIIAVWADAYEKTFPGLNCAWLIEIQDLFEWARSDGEESGEIDADFRFRLVPLSRHRRWTRTISDNSGVNV